MKRCDYVGLDNVVVHVNQVVTPVHNLKSGVGVKRVVMGQKGVYLEVMSDKIKGNQTRISKVIR